jgi:hypothetical protein
MDTPLTVLAADDIRQGELVILTTVGARLLRQASEIAVDTVVARAVEPMKRGSHGNIVFLETKPCPLCQQTMVLPDERAKPESTMFVSKNVWLCVNRQCNYSEVAH